MENRHNTPFVIPVTANINLNFRKQVDMHTVVVWRVTIERQEGKKVHIKFIVNNEAGENLADGTSLVIVVEPGSAKL